jgi:hypothetical protein
MARHVLGGPSDAGRASYQVALSLCPECGRSGQQAGGELVPVGAEVMAMAHCDGQHRGLLHARVANADADASVTANASADTGVGITGNASAHTGVATTANASAHMGVGARAKQTIAPATRRAVLRRDHHCCTVPGCRNALFLDLHHIELSSEGGGNRADNLITLCGVHHRAAHRGALSVVGSVSRGVRFQHADGSDYGRVVKPHVVETQAKAFAALRRLGFRERDVRRVLAEISQSSADREPPIESVLRSALARLTACCANS